MHYFCGCLKKKQFPLIWQELTGCTLACLHQQTEGLIETRMVAMPKCISASSDLDS